MRNFFVFLFVVFALLGCHSKHNSLNVYDGNIFTKVVYTKNGKTYSSYMNYHIPAIDHEDNLKADLPIALVISAPSGCGKDTAVNALIENNSQELTKIISVTTRGIRSNEKNHFDYHFVNKEEFAQMAAEDKFIQKATVYGDSRGTLWSDFEDAIKSGKNVVFNVDSQGFRDLKHALKNKANVIGIFILPPSKDELRRRLNVRGTEKPEVIEYRMSLVNDAMHGFEIYDYKIIGDSKEETLKRIESIYRTLNIKLATEKMNEHGQKVIDSK